MSRKRLHIMILMAAACLSGCSTQSTKWGNVTYHNVSTHYNIWWNGNESLKAGLEILGTTAQDDYTQILPVYKLGTKENAMTVYPQMDRAIEKGIKGVKKHSIFVDGKEHVAYIKECYLLTAYASFYKKDYVAANNSCMLIINQYPGTRAADEAQILAARCLTMDQQYDDAAQMLDQLQSDLDKGAVDKSVAEKIYMAQAECALPQEKYKKAVQNIQAALKETKDHTTKARLNFILGQIYQKLDKKAAATNYYEEVLKYRPDYVMEFNAKINIASCANFENSDIPKLEKSLDNMLEDKKNEEFKDQIYYAKGEMYMGVKNAKKACDNYRKSVAAATNNKPQKAKSALRLAGILYDLYENYDLAQTYYDTAMKAIDKSYPHYFDIKNRYDMLTELVSYTRVFERNDSLIRVADMDSAERVDFINKKIEKLKKDEEEARKQAIIAQYQQDAKAQENSLKGSWYFYNANTVQKGKDKFKNTWGMRMLEDNWFLSNKATFGMSMIAGMDMGSDQTDTTTEAEAKDTAAAKKSEVTDNPNDPHCYSYYLKDLPKTEADRDSMQHQTAECLMNAGYIYNDGLGNTTKALECYLRLANDYTDYDGIVRALYQLYRIYDKQGNTPQSNYYRDMVLMGFPDSDFANMIRDADYYKEIIRREQRIQEDYEDLYTMYRRRRYSQVVETVDQTITNYPNDAMLGKFRYWKGLALARQDKKNEAQVTFEQIVADYPATDSIVPLAQEQLAMLKGDGKLSDNISNADELKAKEQEGDQIKPRRSSTTTDEDAPLSAAAQMYRYRENMQHYVIIVVNDKKVRCTEMQTKVANFNSQYYANAGLKVNLFMFTDTTQLVTVHRFDNAQSAMDYYTHLQQAEGPLGMYDKSLYTVIPISTQNYSNFYNKKNLDAYLEFFNRYYKKKQ